MDTIKKAKAKIEAFLTSIHVARKENWEIFLPAAGAVNFSCSFRRKPSKSVKPFSMQYFSTFSIEVLPIPRVGTLRIRFKETESCGFASGGSMIPVRWLIPRLFFVAEPTIQDFFDWIVR